ncbi:low temperature requirement protein A [Limosilactobacillus sp. WF-MT5-A]|uniref:low temperature requirement protein A n=1 Tax=Limosilactobacillus agrestis TaxID=2759748 RepID=UPI0015FB09E9|nr:low temperature requirement protein A [Limosilactobacillus agrestis]MBB1098628.1 low temperature requirement protein A [Limosilactobacillus agrestis]MCD7112146.1 low temperature requirement protein A [Limosilactobacillus agrestis]MCD7125878.1 low temperature requirement protein A [Limosilactobacillus agrestis]
MADEITKRVSLVELFYDLVFVYMVSRATEMIHHLHHGIVGLPVLGIFAIVVIVFINSWMVQMVFTNRYGKLSGTNIVFSFVDMAILLYMSNSFSTTFDWHLAIFFVAAGLLSLTLCIQYVLVYFQTEKKIDKQITQAFIGILIFRSVTLFIGGIFYQSKVGVAIAFAGIIISWIAPGFTGKYTKHHPIIFSHLLERLTALIIVMFGETIVGIADYFTATNFSVQSILIFTTVAALFFTYIVEFDHLINEHQRHETGNLMIYLHYFILFGLSLVTVAMKFIDDTEADPRFAVTCMYFGFALFYIGLGIANYYNKVRVNKTVVSIFIVSTIAGFGISWFYSAFTLVVIIMTAVTLINAVTLTRFRIKYVD